MQQAYVSIGVIWVAPEKMNERKEKSFPTPSTIAMLPYVNVCAGHDNCRAYLFISDVVIARE